MKVIEDLMDEMKSDKKEVSLRALVLDPVVKPVENDAHLTINVS